VEDLEKRWADVVADLNDKNRSSIKTLEKKQANIVAEL
jgi:hypothetical protein